MFLNYAPKHRLWVLVRTTSPIYVLSKIRKISKHSTDFLLLFFLFIFYVLRKICILHGHVFVMTLRSHYENLPMQYTEIFKVVKNEKFQ